jgi:hypothetical protein
MKSNTVVVIIIMGNVFIAHLIQYDLMYSFLTDMTRSPRILEMPGSNTDREPASMRIFAWFSSVAPEEFTFLLPYSAVIAHEHYLSYVTRIIVIVAIFIVP